MSNDPLDRIWSKIQSLTGQLEDAYYRQHESEFNAQLSWQSASQSLANHLAERQLNWERAGCDDSMRDIY